MDLRQRVEADVKRMDRIRSLAPQLLISLERTTVYIETSGMIPPCVREARKLITQARGE